MRAFAQAAGMELFAVAEWETVKVDERAAE